MLKTYYRFIVGIFLTAIAVWNAGCNIINPSEPVATHVRIDSFSFENGARHDIRYAWVYYNNNPVGAFDLPATVPIIASGKGTLQIAPGIPIDGRGERPVAYPFFRIYTTELNYEPGKIQTVSPTTGYYDSVKYTVISEFEGGITKFAKYFGTTSITTTSVDSLKLDGTGTGLVLLQSPNDSSIDSTRAPFKVPEGAAFIEFEYKSSLNVQIGIRGLLSNVLITNIDARGVYPSATWKKFYFNITGFINKQPGGDYYFYIKTSVPPGQTSGKLLIDNIRLVTF
ncbi:MAG: hypothetical protein JNM41_03675 [Flavipsychrobacter sp.]|nr:hypothetical protein [Flavipsychrobacter sp.]